jgi:hypothetical protein
VHYLRKSTSQGPVANLQNVQNEKNEYLSLIYKKASYYIKNIVSFFVCVLVIISPLVYDSVPVLICSPIFVGSGSKRPCMFPLSNPNLL